jgi:uncharacterized protein (DUF1810 family)
LDDPSGLARFLEAQEDDYADALAEIEAGAKRTHWIWYVFPQIEGLGSSPRARYFGLSGIEEAAAYLAHPVLGPRLIRIAEAALTHAGTPAERLMGSGIDAAKLRSCATLFARVPGAPDVFGRMLDAFHGGRPCGRTLERLGTGGA